MIVLFIALSVWGIWMIVRIGADADRRMEQEFMILKDSRYEDWKN